MSKINYRKAQRPTNSNGHIVQTVQHSVKLIAILIVNFEQQKLQIFRWNLDKIFFGWLQRDTRRLFWNFDFLWFNLTFWTIQNVTFSNATWIISGLTIFVQTAKYLDQILYEWLGRNFFYIHLNCIRSHTYCASCLKFESDILWMVNERLKEAFLKIMIFSDFIVIFHERKLFFSIFT